MDEYDRAELLMWIKNYRRRIIADTYRIVDQLDRLEAMIREYE